MFKLMKLCLISLSLMMLFSGSIVAHAQDSPSNDREIMRLGRGRVNALAWHPDGEVLAVASGNGLWLLDSELNIIRQETMLDSVSAVKWSPDGTQIALAGTLFGTCYAQVWDSDFSTQIIEIEACSDDLKWNPASSRLAVVEPYRVGQVRLIDTRNGIELATRTGLTATWSYDGASLITTTTYTYHNYDLKNTIFIWDGDTGEQILIRDEDDYPPRLLWAIDETTFATRCYVQDDVSTVNICTYDMDSGESEIQIEFEVRDGSVRTMQQSNDNLAFSFIIDSIRNGFVDNLWVLNLDTNERSHLGVAEMYTWHPSDEFVTTSTGNGTMRNVDVATGDVLNEAMHFTAPINSLDWRPDSQQIATVGFGYEQYVRVWDSDVSVVEPELLWYTEPTEFVNYTPDGSELVTSGTIRTDIYLNHTIDGWNPDTGEHRRNIFGYSEQGGSLPFRAWNADFTRFAWSEGDNRLWINENLAVPTSYEIVIGAFWSPDGTMIASVSRLSQDISYIIEVWNAETGELINWIQGTMSSFNNLHWSPDSAMLVENIGRLRGGGWWIRAIRLYVVEKDRNYGFDNSELEVDDNYDNRDGGAYYPLNIAWNSNNTMIAVTLNSSVAVYEVGSFGRDFREPLLEIPLRDMSSIAWSPDDTRIAFGGVDGVVHIWDVSDLMEE